MHILQLKAAEHNIESLTVFRAGNAEVVRSFDLSLKSGDYEIEITGLANHIAPDSVRVSGLGSEARLVDLVRSVKNRNTGFQPQHSEAMRKLLVRKQALEAEKQIREQENDIHLTYYQHRSSDGLLGAELNQFLQTFVEMRKGILQAIHDLDEQIYEVTKLIIDQNEKESTAKQVDGQVKLYLLVEKECDVKLKLTYVVLDAMWEPIYDLHANISEDGKPSSRVMLHYRARITQSSGEDWKNARLTLSTATQNKQRVEVPKLPIYRLKYKSTVSTAAVSQGLFGRKPSPTPFIPDLAYASPQPVRVTVRTPSPVSSPNISQPLSMNPAEFVPPPPAQPATCAVVGQSALAHQSQQQSGAPGRGFGLFQGTATQAQTPAFARFPSQSTSVSEGGLFGRAAAQVLTPSFGQFSSQPTVSRGSGFATSTQREDELMLNSEDATIIRSSPLTTSYTVEGAFNVPSDGAAHTVSISNFNLKADVTRVCIPRMNAEVMLQCKVQNTSDYRFLPGPVSIFLNDSFVTKTTLGVRLLSCYLPHSAELTLLASQEVVPKDHFECALGTDPSMRIRYKLSRVTSSGSRSMFGAKIRMMACAAETTIANKNGFAVSDLVVRDALPVAGEETIRVELVKPEKLADTQGDKLLEMDDTTKVRWSKEADGEGW
ncbi:hypothetical protein NM688_g5254 [Phlebia brevispora]|uniref:Uncharacterized protein n=1 Tax=Phlebia brevispora TaxID=194682 RepID=A0ACC1SXX8_9APHY|nr:hypothetical protein NM688_g5254 [Phlebia brevispora]